MKKLEPMKWIRRIWQEKLHCTSVARCLLARNILFLIFISIRIKIHNFITICNFCSNVVFFVCSCNFRNMSNKDDGHLQTYVSYKLTCIELRGIHVLKLNFLSIS